MSVVDRWWCLNHGISDFYWLAKGSSVRLCGFVEPDGRQCTFPVRKEAKLDQLTKQLGDAAIDHYLAHAIGGPYQ